MHDLRAIRDNPEAFDAGLKRRGLPPRADEVLALDRAGRTTETQLQEAQALGNRLAREIGTAKKAGGDAAELMRQSAENKASEAQLAQGAAGAGEQINELLASLPTLPAEDVPEGPDETANVLLRTV